MIRMRIGAHSRRRAVHRARHAAVLLALLASLLPGMAWAHALVVASTPTANSEVDGAEVAFDLQFNSRLDQRRARLRLVPTEGEPSEVPLAASDDPAHLRGRATALAPGAYRIEWYVLSPDGHVTRGYVPFKVRTP
ncbi:MAG: copper resistance protein CopC [Gammaproteobacteria bacterium]